MSFNRFYVISPLALVALSACRSPNGGQAVNGVISKGPLSNALVFLDLDGDNVLDAGEQSIRTDANGNFTINTTATDYKIVALTDASTVDSSSGATLAGVMLTAPKGAAVVSPTSTLMEEGGLTAEEVAEVLNLPDGVDPLEFNPYANDVDAADALAVEKISQQIMTAVSSFASAAEGAGASESGAFEAALTSVVEVVKVKAEKLDDTTATEAEKSLDFTNAADLNLIKAKVADEAEKVVTAEGTAGFDKAALTALVDDTATSIKNVNDQIETVTDLTSDATKNVFSTLQVLAEQVKTAAVAEKASSGSGSIEFTNAAKVASAASNFAPQDITISADSILEGTKDLVIGSLATVDKDQGDGVAFTYEIAEADGTDHALFEINSNGELVLKETPDYSEKSSYELFVVTTDDGGKQFSKKIEIEVTPDPHENFLVKFTVNYVEEGDVGAEYNTILGSSATNYEEFLTRLHTNMDALDAAISFGFPHEDSLELPNGSEIDFSDMSYAERFTALQNASIVPPSVSESISTGVFTVSYVAPNQSGGSDIYKMAVKIEGLTAVSSNDYGGLDGNEESVDYFDPETWSVDGGLKSITISKGSNAIFTVNVDDTSMEIKAEAAFATDYANDDVGSILMEGDFSKTNANDFFDILDQLSLDPSSSSSSSSSDPFGSSYSNESMSGSNSHEHTNESGSSSSSSGSNSGSNYTIETVKIYNADSNQTNGLTADPVGIAKIADGSLSLQLGNYKMSLISDDLPDYITAGDIFDFANVDLLDVEEVIKDGVDGLFTLSHTTHGDLVIIESDMSNATAGEEVIMGDGETFGTYEGKRFVSDSNDIVAAYFDFGDLEVTDAQFEAYWETIDGITDMFADIA